MRSPGITALFEEKQRILYMANVASLEEQSRANLSKSFESLGLTDGQQILVADVTSPTGKIFVLRSVSWKSVIDLFAGLLALMWRKLLISSNFFDDVNYKMDKVLSVAVKASKMTKMPLVNVSLPLN